MSLALSFLKSQHWLEDVWLLTCWKAFLSWASRGNNSPVPSLMRLWRWMLLGREGAVQHRACKALSEDKVPGCAPFLLSLSYQETSPLPPHPLCGIKTLLPNILAKTG